MNRLFISILVLIFMTSCGGSSEETLTTDIVDNPNTAAPDNNNGEEKMPFFEFEEEVKDFGEIIQGEVVSTSFQFKNVGEVDLIISSAQGSCGCTVPKWPKEPIKPGAKGVIDVTFDSNGKHGAQNKTITLVANTIPNTKVIALKGNVLAPKEEN